MLGRVDRTDELKASLVSSLLPGGWVPKRKPKQVFVSEGEAVGRLEERKVSLRPFVHLGEKDLRLLRRSNTNSTRTRAAARKSCCQRLQCK